MNPKTAKASFSQIFDGIIPSLRQAILKSFQEYDSKGGYKIVWEEFEDVMNNPLHRSLTSTFPLPIEIIKTTTKSRFPDWTIKWNGKVYAIDVKSGEDVMDPWYDMGRLDTFEKRHLSKYEDEYYITVKWQKEKDKIKVLDVFIEPFYKSCGYDANTKGIKFRPYDGKLRPKGWKDFESGKSYWSTKEEFLKGLALSKKCRRVALILEWVEEMNSEELKILKQSLTKIKKLDFK